MNTDEEIISKILFSYSKVVRIQSIFNMFSEMQGVQSAQKSYTKPYLEKEIHNTCPFNSNHCNHAARGR